MQTKRINLGTYSKEQAINIREQLKRVKSFRKDGVVGVDFKSRTYGNENNYHDHSMPVSQAKEVAVYVDLDTRDNSHIELDHETKRKLVNIVANKWLNNEDYLMKLLMNGTKGVNMMSGQELFEELVKLDS